MKAQERSKWLEQQIKELQRSIRRYKFEASEINEKASWLITIKAQTEMKASANKFLEKAAMLQSKLVTYQAELDVIQTKLKDRRSN